MMRRSQSKRARQRGFSHVATTLEAAAVLGWLVVLVLGEKLINDAVTARRAVEDTAEQSSVAAAAGYCETNRTVASTIPGTAARGITVASPDGKLDIQNLLALLNGLGIGAQRTMTLYTMPLRSSTSRALQGDVHADPLVGGGSYTFRGERSFACQERAVDIPQTSIADYRKSIFDTNILGF